MEPTTALSIGQAGIGVIQMIGSAIGQAKADADLKKNAKLRPLYKIQKPIKDNQAIAESRASKGLNDRTLNNYNEFTQRNLTASLNTMMMGGTAMNNIGEVFSSADAGERKLAIMDDEMQARNVRELVLQNREMGGELDKEWMWNVQAPWKDKQQAILARLQKNQQGVSDGINTVANAAANYVTSKQYEKEGDQVFGNKVAEATSAVAGLDRILGRSTGAAGAYGQETSRAMPIEDQMRLRYPGLIGGGPLKRGNAYEYIDE
jgi:hypothetical protein